LNRCKLPAYVTMLVILIKHYPSMCCLMQGRCLICSNFTKQTYLPQH